MAHADAISTGLMPPGRLRPDLAQTPTGRAWAKLAIVAFMLSLLTPILINLGPVVLMPHRLVLLVTFFPCLFLLFTGRAGRLVFSDYALFLAGLWNGVALLSNHGLSFSLEPFGLYFLEFFGAYLLARVAIRSAAEFITFVKTFLVIMVVLVPFALAESVLNQPVMLNLIPGSYDPVYRPLRLGLRRAQASFAHPILFGVFVSTALGLFWFVIRPRWTRVPTTMLVYIATICSLSTGALISVVVQTVLIGYETVFSVIRRRWGLFLSVAALIYVTLDLLSNRTPFHILVDYASFNSGNAYNRILIWQYGTQNIAANPLFGIGFNEWARPVWMSSSIDNFWLLQAIQYGLPLAFLLIASVIVIVVKTARARVNDPLAMACRAGFLVSFAGIAIAGGTVHYWHAMMAFVMFFFGTPIWLFNSKERSEPPGGVAEVQEDQTPAASRYSRFAPKPTQPSDQPKRKPSMASRRRGSRF